MLSPLCAGCVEQEQGSAFLTNLNATATVPGVQYTVIESKDDEVVTPFTNAFLPAASNVTNITVQNQCPQDMTIIWRWPTTRSPWATCSMPWTRPSR